MGAMERWFFGGIAFLVHRKFRLIMIRKMADKKGAEGISAVYHETVIAGPIISNSKNVGKFAAADKALAALRDADEGSLQRRLCDCREVSEEEEVVRMVVDI